MKSVFRFVAGVKGCVKGGAAGLVVTGVYVGVTAKDRVKAMFGY